ncbi:MAG: PDZ domain-containing protein [Planctomycetota bacterium]
MTSTAMLPITIQADSVPPHGNRGTCTNCHTVVKSRSPSARLTPVGVAAPAISPNAVPPTLIKEFGIEVSSAGNAGVKVTGIMGNSYASKAGLRVGDIIIKCNRTKVHGVEQFQQQVSRAAPEADAQITVLRNSRTRDLAIMVGEGEMEGFTPIP